MSTCKTLNIHDNYVNTLDDYVNMQLIYFDMQDNHINMQDSYVNIQLTKSHGDINILPCGRRRKGFLTYNRLSHRPLTAHTVCKGLLFL